MARVQIDAVRGRAAPRHDLEITRPRDHVARGALQALRVVALHDSVRPGRCRAARRRRASPSSSNPPVAMESPTSRPVGWNCSISMSTKVAPARHAIAIPSPDFSSDGDEIRYMVAPPPVASRVALARTAIDPAGANIAAAARRRCARRRRAARGRGTPATRVYRFRESNRAGST